MPKNKRYSLTDVATNFLETVKEGGTVEVRKTVFSLLRAIILKTPVKTGIAQSNWQIAISKPNNKIIEFSGESSQAKNKAMTEGLSELAKAQFGQTIYILNNLDYIGALEQGSSKQAAHGMVDVSINELRTLFK